MEMKVQGEWIRNTYRVLKSFPFVIGILYFTEVSSRTRGLQTRFIHALDVRAVSDKIQKEQILSRDDAVFFPVREVFIENDILYQVFHRLEGKLLAHYLHQNTPLSISEMCWIVRGITSHLLRLYEEHQFTLVHPQNIVLAPGKAIRFLYGGPLGALPKGVGKGMGDFLDDRETDYLYDSYTLGVMIYHMLTGRNPMASGLFIPPVSTYCPNCPPELDELVTRAISFDIKKRPKIKEIARFLDRLAERVC
ncbi:hypothetical protein ACFO25_20010 [Paenactinomyces guangxiensis]|uniref:Protein kinase domain-containing protein n=1 Tax=Paenactinomyces guangxiensis TaxID=1490290 RepID=A0A7W1WTN0_9BACL|nr:hypothetical protein [Paenactinomyces guangxiensis]MBA4495777.1 hypothetical protein [Paenactinomyces guangxiensis]MBH8592867.1 hypothetical protein [Paenactinomyces guangxiensis]